MLLLATEIWRSHGGVQRYMRQLVEILEQLQLHPVPLSLIDHSGGNKVAFVARALRLARKEPSRTVIAGHPALAPVAWALKQLRLADRYFVVLHGKEAWKRGSLLTRLAARDAARVVATTAYTGGEFCVLNGVHPERCRIIPLAAPEAIQPGEEVEYPELRLLTIARLASDEQYKGVDTVLAAIRQLRDSRVAVRYEVIGDGDDRPRIETVARSLGVEELVRFRGSVSDEQVAAALSACDVFVMPSKFEGFGIAYLEAMAAGLPCIGANHGGVPAVIEHGESGFLVEFGDVDQIAFYLRALSESAPLRATMSRAALARAQFFSFSRMKESWRKLLCAD